MIHHTMTYTRYVLPDDISPDDAKGWDDVNTMMMLIDDGWSRRIDGTSEPTAARASRRRGPRFALRDAQISACPVRSQSLALQAVHSPHDCFRPVPSRAPGSGLQEAEAYSRPRTRSRKCRHLATGRQKCRNLLGINRKS